MELIVLTNAQLVLLVFGSFVVGVLVGVAITVLSIGKNVDSDPIDLSKDYDNDEFD